jgi:hypothetical protein
MGYLNKHLAMSEKKIYIGDGVDQYLKMAYPKAPSLSYLNSDIAPLRHLIQIGRCRHVQAHVHTCSVMSPCWTVIVF